MHNVCFFLLSSEAPPDLCRFFISPISADQNLIERTSRATEFIAPDNLVIKRTRVHTNLAHSPGPTIYLTGREFIVELFVRRKARGGKGRKTSKKVRRYFSSPLFWPSIKSSRPHRGKLCCRLLSQRGFINLCPRCLSAQRIQKNNRKSKSNRSALLPLDCFNISPNVFLLFAMLFSSEPYIPIYN